jgi:hypothetical protein
MADEKDLTTAIETAETTAAATFDELASEEGFDFTAFDGFAHKGCERLHRLLATLLEVFPDNHKLRMWKTLFETGFLNIPQNERQLMDKWHDEMTKNKDGSARTPTLYQLTRERKLREVLDAKLYVFEQIGAREMYFESDLDDDEREEICKHFDGINACAEWMHAMPTDMVSAVMDSVRKLDSRQQLTPDVVFSIMQKVIGANGDDEEDGISQDKIDRLVGWTTQIMKTMENGGMQSLTSIAGEGALSALGPNFSGVLDMAQKLASSSKGLGSETLKMDESDYHNVMQTLKSMGGSVGGGGASL